MPAPGEWALTAMPNAADGTSSLKSNAETRAKSSQSKSVSNGLGGDRTDRAPSSTKKGGDKLGGTGPGGGGGVRNTKSPKSPQTNTKGKTTSTADKLKQDINDLRHGGRSTFSKLETLAKEKAKEILRREESFIGKAKYDVNAPRVGYGSDSYVDENGVWQGIGSVKNGTTVTKEQAEKDLEIRTQMAMDRAKAQVGEAQWNKLSSNVKAGLTQTAYNYGSVPKEVRDVARATVDPNRIGNAIEGLKDDNNYERKDRYERVADIVRGVTPLTVREQPNLAPSPARKALENALPKVGDVIKAMPDNIPFKKATEKGFSILKGFVEGKKPTQEKVGEAAGEVSGDLAGILGGPFGGIIGPIVKNRVEGAIKDGLTIPKESGAKLKEFAGIIGGVLGGPIGLAAGVTVGAGLDAAEKISNAPGRTPGNTAKGGDGAEARLWNKFMSKPTGYDGGGNLYSPKRVETPQSTLTTMANQYMYNVPSDENGIPTISGKIPTDLNAGMNSLVVSPASENGSKSILEALSDPAYNPLNAEFWNDAAWSFAIVIIGISLIGFGAYSMMAGSSNTTLKLEGAA